MFPAVTNILLIVLTSQASSSRPRGCRRNPKRRRLSNSGIGGCSNGSRQLVWRTQGPATVHHSSSFSSTLDSVIVEEHGCNKYNNNKVTARKINEKLRFLSPRTLSLSFSSGRSMSSPLTLQHWIRPVA